MLQTILPGSPSIPTQPTTETIERHGQTRKTNLATQSREAELHSRDRGWILRRTKNSTQNGRESVSPPLPPTLTISETNFQNSLKKRESETERGGGTKKDSATAQRLAESHILQLHQNPNHIFTSSHHHQTKQHSPSPTRTRTTE